MTSVTRAPVSCNSGSFHKFYAWAAMVRAANRAMLARISSAVLVQTKGLESTLCASMYSRIARFERGDAAMHAPAQLLGR